MLECQSRALKDADLGLVFKKTWAKNMVHWVGAQGQINLPKIQKHALIVTSPSENPKLKRKKNFWPAV